MGLWCHSRNILVDFIRFQQVLHNYQDSHFIAFAYLGTEVDPGSSSVCLEYVFGFVICPHGPKTSICPSFKVHKPFQVHCLNAVQEPNATSLIIFVNTGTRNIQHYYPRLWVFLIDQLYHSAFKLSYLYYNHTSQHQISTDEISINFYNYNLHWRCHSLQMMLLSLILSQVLIFNPLKALNLGLATFALKKRDKISSKQQS